MLRHLLAQDLDIPLHTENAPEAPVNIKSVRFARRLYQVLVLNIKALRFAWKVQSVPANIISYLHLTRKIVLHQLCLGLYKNGSAKSTNHDTSLQVNRSI